MTEDDTDEHVEEISIVREIDVLDYLEGVTFECSDCSLRFETKDAFMQHSNENHEKSASKQQKKLERPECPECNVAFTRRNNLMRHLKKFHKHLVPPLRRVIYDELCTHKCPVCEGKFTRKSNLLRHIRKFHEFLVPTLFRQSPKLFSCPECNTGFTKWSNCKRHIRHFHETLDMLQITKPIANGDDKYLENREVKLEFEEIENEHSDSLDDTNECIIMPCSNCDLVFAKPCELQAHIGSVHSMITVQPNTFEEKVCPFCSICDTKLNLYLHLTSVHDCPILIECQDFDSVEEFEVWRKQIEMETCCQFIELSKRMKPDGSGRTIFVCSQSNENLEKSQSSGFCPAEITLDISEGKCEVYFVKTHVGHDDRIKIGESA